MISLSRPGGMGEGRGEGLSALLAPLFRLLVLGGSRAGAAALGSLSAVVLARGLSPEGSAGGR